MEVITQTIEQNKEGIPVRQERSVNIQGLVNTLKSRKPAVKRFRFDSYTPTQVTDMLVAACQAEVEHRMRTFRLTASCREHLSEVAQWLTSKDDPRFGLYLSGGAGNGKTTILKAIQSLVNLQDSSTHGGDSRGCIIINAKELNRLARAFYNPSRETQNEADKFKRLRDIEILAIDDLGTEPRETMYYGDYITPVIDILSDRYDRQACTLISTNLATSDITEHYDGRIYDRFKEMMKVVNFSNEKSFR